MNETLPAYLTGGLILTLVLGAVFLFRSRFDPFAPVWLFLIGYFQVYVIQALSYRDWAVSVHGEQIVESANWRAFWAILVFLAVYAWGPGRWVSGKVPRAPFHWSMPTLSVVVPCMLTWGFFCSVVMIIQGTETETSKGEQLLRQFYFMMLGSGILLMVTGSKRERPAKLLFLAGLCVAMCFVMLWIFQGKRSPSLIGILACACAYYGPRFKRPPVAVLLVLALVGSMVVAVSLAWRNQRLYDRSATGFVQFLADFDPSTALVNLNLAEAENPNAHKKEFRSKETEEYGGFLLMISTVPERSGYDYGANYLRLFTTFIPRIVWQDKPLPGRDKWIAAWMAGSEFKRDDTFTGPAIGILGALQLNGGAPATAIVMSIIAVLLRSAYEYYRRYQFTCWAQAWWALTYYNAWLMTVNDDPLVWFYYIYGFSIMPPMVFLWLINRFAETDAEARWAERMRHWRNRRTTHEGQVVGISH
jgi:hypothetical protein